jgi:hypothetical protein
MKKVLLLIFSASIFFGCQTEELTVANDEEATVLKRGGQTLNEPNIVEVSALNINTCKNDYLSDVADITITSDWEVGDHTTNDYIDFVLQDALSCSFNFSTCLVRLNGPPTEIKTVDFILYDNGYIIQDPLTNETTAVYDYLSTDISPSTAEELKKHFACEIKEYQATYYADAISSFVSYVDFEGNQTLCTCDTGDTHFLNATVTFYNYY